MDRAMHNSMENPFNGHLGYREEDRYNMDEFANHSFDYNMPIYPHQMDPYQIRPSSNSHPSSLNASEFSNGYFGGPQGLSQGLYTGRPTDVVSNLSEDVNPLDERFSEHSFVPSIQNQVMPVIPERSISRNSNRQMYNIDQGDSWTQQQGSFVANNPSPILNNSYRPQSILNKSHSSNNQFAFDSNSKIRKPELAEVIEFLSHQSDAAKANAAAFLQHLSYMDDNVKIQTRVLGGIPPLLQLVNHPQPEVHRAACGALRNLSYGRINDDNKREIKNNGGITTLVRLIRRTSDQETLELVTGIIWNLSSCAELKKPIIDEGIKTLLDQIILPLSKGTEEQQMNFPIYRSVIFRNASGILRNVSSDGDYARKKMRECEGLIGSLLVVVQQSLVKDDCNNKCIENCVCVLRNLSYACQEMSDPDYLKKKIITLDDRDPKTGCFGNKSKSTNKQKKSSTSSPMFDHTKYPNSREMSQLWSPEVLDLYLPLLSCCINPDTLEATAGAIQNLVACDWQPSKDLREAVRRKGGIEIMIRLLVSSSPDKVICSSARSLRNLALDEKCRDLIGKHAMKSLVEVLPSSNYLNTLSSDTLLAIQSTLYEVIKSNSSFARVFIDAQGVHKLMYISNSPPGLLDEKVVRYSRQLLQKIWKYNELHDELKKAGWGPNDFIFPTWTRSSAENTINRPIMSQGRNQPDASLKGPICQSNEEAMNQNSLARASSSYSLSKRNDNEIPLDAFHAMQLNSQSSRDVQYNDNIKAWNNHLPTPNFTHQGDRYSQQDGYFDPSRAYFASEGGNAGVYYTPEDPNMNFSMRTSNNMGSPDQQHFRSEPLVPKNDSWI